MGSRWPTDLESDGTAPINVMLVGGDDEHLQRQAMYQLQAGVQLQDRGYAIVAFQVPVVGKMARITVPITATTPAGEKAAIYTQSEDWTPDRLSDLQTWIADLREESDVAVVVASRLPPLDAAQVPQVSEWLHLPYDTLNRRDAPAPEPREPVMPCLKERQWQGREHAVCRALWEKEASAYMPWVAVGYDRPHTFEFISNDRLGPMNTTEQALEAEALANLRARAASWEKVDLDAAGETLRMLTCTGDYFAAEQLLNVAFMQQAQQRLKARGLLVGVPRRGVMMAVNAELDAQLVTAFGAVVAGEFRRGETAPISPMLFAVKDGAIVAILEEVADALVRDNAGGDEEEADADDPGSPYVTAVTTRNDRGTEDVHLMAGGQDGERLALAIEHAFMALMKQHGGRKEFSGHIQVVVLANTPASERTHIPNTIEHLRGIGAEVSKSGGRRYRVTLTYQRGDAATPSARDAAPPSVTAAPKPAAAVPSRRSWTRPAMVLVPVVAGIALAYFGIRQGNFPGSIVFGGTPLSQATKWSRGGISGAVYVPAGETMPAASTQIGVIISTEHASAHELLSWIREQARASGAERYHDSGIDTDTCIVGMNGVPGGRRTYMALQLCKAATGRVACVESDEVLDPGLFDSCLTTVGCFDAECGRRWSVARGSLDQLAAGALEHNIR